LADKETEQAQIRRVQTEARRIAPLLPEERALAAVEDARTRKRFFVDMPASPALLREALFHYAKGDPPELAAKKAGLKDLAAFKLYLQSDSIGSDLRAMMRGVLETDYAPKAFAFLNATVHDTAVPARIRVDAAKIIVDRAGYVAAPPDAARDPKDLTLMTREELHKFVIDAEAKLASQAKDVTPGESPDQDESDGTPPPAEAAP